MFSYLPPTAVLSIFNPQNFGVADTININSATLQADTDLILAEANAQNTKFLAMSSLPAKNLLIAFTGSFNVGATGVNYTMPYTLSTGYYYIISATFNFLQIGTPLAITAVNVTNNWLNTTNSWSSLNTSNAIYGFPSLQFTIQGLGTGSQPVFTFTFPTTSGYTTNTNTFNATGYYSIIGIKIAGV